jgi:DNA-binding NtrC family response regulator
MSVSIPAILLIEDDEITLELYQRELSKSFSVHAFSSLQGVLEAIDCQDIRAIVIEPEVDSGKGWELIKTIAALEPAHSIPMIVCSTTDNRKPLVSLLVKKYLIKPVLPRTLREMTLEIIPGEENQVTDP